MLSTVRLERPFPIAVTGAHRQEAWITQGSRTWKVQLETGIGGRTFKLRKGREAGTRDLLCP